MAAEHEHRPAIPIQFSELWIFPEMMTCQTPFSLPGGSGWWGTQLRGCPPAFGLLLYAAALSAPSACSFKQAWHSKYANHRCSLPRVLPWVT